MRRTADSPSAAQLCRQAGESLHVALDLQPQGAWQTQHIALSDSLVVHLATTPDARQALLVEAARRRWAFAAGVPVPTVVAVAPDGSWLASGRVADDAAEGAAYVDGALEAARRIAAAGAPPDAAAAGSRSWSGGRRSLLARAVRGARSPLSLREFRAVRAEADQLPRSTLAHNDFHVGNVLHDAGSGTVHVIDFEYLAPAPPHSDALSLWPDLARTADRERLLDAVVAGADRAELPAIGLLLHWSALRLLAFRATGEPRSRQDRAQVEIAAQRVAEAREQRARLDVPRSRS